MKTLEQLGISPAPVLLAGIDIVVLSANKPGLGKVVKPLLRKKRKICYNMRRKGRMGVVPSPEAKKQKE